MRRTTTQKYGAHSGGVEKNTQNPKSGEKTFRNLQREREIFFWKPRKDFWQ